jgi:uncharacterized membrane protein YfcA
MRIALVTSAAAAVGSVAGALTGCRLRPESLRRGFAVLVLGTASVMAYGQIVSGS